MKHKWAKEIKGGGVRMKPHEISDQYAKAIQQAYEDGFVQGKIYEQSGRVSCGKTIPKEPQYLYVYGVGNECQIHLGSPMGSPAHYVYIGKIKLEEE